MSPTVRQSVRSSREEDHHRRIENHRKKNLENNEIKLTKCYPLQRNDQLTLLSKLIKNDSRNLKLANAGTGSGKTNCMFDIADTSMAKIVAICAPNSKVQGQLYDAARLFKFTKSNVLTYLFQNITPEIIWDNIKKNIKTIIFVSNIRSKKNKYTKNSKKFIDLISLFPNICLTIFDELHQQLTSLTGSAQPRTDLNDTNISEFRKFYEKNICDSLNIFDVLRQHNIPAIGLSATLNNLICNKLGLLGYEPKDISILNVYPIYALYKQQIKHVDTSKFDELVPYIERAEKTDITCKILLVFSCEKDIHQFKEKYRNYFHKEINSSDITSNENQSHSQVKEGIRKSKYIIGIDMITTGFDVSTLVKNSRFILGIIFRDFNDKSSQPLSKNLKNKLSNNISASLLQVVARIRDKGLIIMDNTHSEFKSLYEEHVKIFNIINEGYNEVYKYGYNLTRQIDRHVHTIFISIIQNINEGSNGENRPKIQKLITKIKELTTRDIESDLLDINIMKTNYNIYTDAIKRIWLNEIGIILPEAELPRVISNQTSHASTIYANYVETDDEEPAQNTSNDTETDDEQPAQINSNDAETDDEQPAQINSNDAETDDETEDEDISDITDSETNSSPTVNSSINTPPTIISSGNGRRKGRRIEKKIKDEVWRRSKNKCFVCTLIIDRKCGDKGQLSHIQRYDRNGPNTLENMTCSHCACDALLDNAQIILNPDGVWYFKLYLNHNIDGNQWQGIRRERLLDRWEWAKGYLGCESFTDNAFCEELKERGYEFRPMF